ncbi:sigma-54-dependent transcriptional regulator [Deferrisoma camini]|uniref:sigma-54-dependent transcriptional regulator n=1 Tax=Deferrisoma camini TaxID=1035120 RepID=UPI00046CCD2C|nr:sigma-54 dependent transcriptional regulator [Deferrisoma camini]
MRTLIVDDERSIREGLAKTLRRMGHEAEVCSDGASALDCFRQGDYHLVFLDLKMPGLDGMEVLARMRELDPEVIVVIITGYPSIDNVLKAFRLGAYDYLPKPFSPQEVRITTARAEERRRLRFENEQLRRQLQARTDRYVIGSSPRMREVNALIEKVAATDTSVLITGESGTGKEVVARMIYELSPRKDREFVAVDCSALAGPLLESELFGHVKGAFTGAHAPKRGLLELANGGTFFLDEVGNLGPETQAKLLRVLQEREIKPVGGVTARKVDVRIIAATNADLEQEVKEGRFRGDLYYRLAVFPIHLPPLRERMEDLPELVRHFVAKHAPRVHKRFREVSPGFLSVLAGYNFPGNIRELENIVQRAVLLEESDVLRPSSLPAYLLKNQPNHRKRFPTLEELERDHIALVLRACDGQKTRAAEVLGIDRKTLYRKIKQYGLGG